MTEEAKTEAAKPEAPKAEAPKPVAPKAEAAKPVVEKQTNCLACNKPIIKLKHYYRDGKFYCSKQCWKKAVLKAKEEKAKEEKAKEEKAKEEKDGKAQ